MIFTKQRYYPKESSFIFYLLITKTDYKGFIIFGENGSCKIKLSCFVILAESLSIVTSFLEFITCEIKSKLIWGIGETNCLKI
jgi:hypothetical protein